MEWSTRRWLSIAAPAGLLSLPMLVWSTVIASSAGATAAPAPAHVLVGVGVVLDLTSEMGRKSLTCISMALDDFYVKHPSYTTRVELRLRDSRGELATAAYAAKDLIKNAQVQAIIWGPQTPTEADFISHLSRRNHIPILSFAGISPTSCVFWLEDPVAASRGHDKIGFTFGNNTILFLDPETGRRNDRKLETGKSRKNCRGHNETTLKIAVPQKQGFQDFVNVAHPNTRNQKVTGYSIDIFEAAMKQLKHPPCYVFCVFNGSYDDLVDTVSSGVYDAAVGDVTITAERATDTDFTMPYTHSGVYMLVLAENEPETVQWTFVKSLTGQLWFATVGFFFYTGFVVWMIERSRNQEYQGSGLRQFSTASYFAFSTLTFSHAQTIRSPMSKIVVVIWCFVVLIIVQSYTASLSSMLTAKRLRPSATDLHQLQLSGDFVGYQDGSFVRSILINNNGINESRLRKYTKKEEYADALRKGSKNGGVSAIVDEIPFITSFLSDPQYENDFMMVSRIYKTPGFGFVFRLGSPLVHDLSTAILNITGGDEGLNIERKWFGTDPLSTGDGGSDTNSTPLTLRSVSGVFVITGVISTLMLLISIVRLVYARCTKVRTADVQSVNNSCGNEGSHPLQNGMGDNPGPDQPLHGAVNNNSQQSGENAGDEEPGPMQQNGMHSGSAPAESNQVELSTV